MVENIDNMEIPVLQSCRNEQNNNLTVEENTQSRPLCNKHHIIPFTAFFIIFAGFLYFTYWITKSYLNTP